MSKENKLDDAWLDRRQKIFKMYCGPSVKNQNTNNFEWVILVHTEVKMVKLKLV
ncbi:hypothetical protein LCGC14_1704940 [marine sediment metagenome]|uniref:Uncharacterized protein n=1 Tax=marine sediment metagenome TaxID=412755 RepID=A0A0F9JXE6_9ZZZZ